MQAEITYSDEVVRIGHHRNLQLIVWAGTPTIASLRACERAARANGRLNSGGIGLMCLMLDGGIPKFTDDVREAVTNFNRDPTLFPLGVANIVLVSGLAGVAVRAFVNTASLLGRPVVPTKAFSSLAEGAEWLAPRLRTDSAPRWSPSDLTRLAHPLTSPPGTTIFTTRRP